MFETAPAREELLGEIQELFRTARLPVGRISRIRSDMGEQWGRRKSRVFAGRGMIGGSLWLSGRKHWLQELQIVVGFICKVQGRQF